MRTIATVACVVLTLQIVKWVMGPGAALFVACVGLALCLGILWGAGDRRTPNPQQEGR